MGGDANHFVIGAETSKQYDKVLVYLPGTTDRTELSSCLLKSVAESLPYPTIGLSYAYLSSGDKFRNGKCQYEGEKMNSIEYQIDCLTQQHIDAIDGGTYGSTHTTAEGKPFWDPVAPDNSITARLGFLLKMLDGKYPDKNWGKFYTDGGVFRGSGSYPIPNWKMIKVMGHSQGAGHAAYLAQTQAILGAVMVSGPQDECIGCSESTKFWIDKASYKSKSYSAFASADEPLVGVMKDNWNRMIDAGATTWKKNFYTDVDFAVDKNALTNIMKGPLLSSILPAFTSTCGGKEHCSTAIDDSVPFIKSLMVIKCICILLTSGLQLHLKRDPKRNQIRNLVLRNPVKSLVEFKQVF